MSFDYFAKGGVRREVAIADAPLARMLSDAYITLSLVMGIFETR
ncbi:hypothetical protein [Nocardia fluminea]